MADNSLATINSEDTLVRPHDQLYRVLQVGGATARTMTITELLDFLGNYIEVRGLRGWMSRNRIFCRDDVLAELLGVTTFSLEEPGVLERMIRRNVTVIDPESPVNGRDTTGTSAAGAGTPDARGPDRDSTAHGDHGADTVADQGAETVADQGAETVGAERDQGAETYGDGSSHAGEPDYLEYEVDSTQSADYDQDFAADGVNEVQLRVDCVFTPCEVTGMHVLSWVNVECEAPDHDAACGSRLPTVSVPVTLHTAHRLPESCLQPCGLCLSSPKNGAIVHGSTAHVMCCHGCATTLWLHGKPCPVCRLPIERVLLTYSS